MRYYKENLESYGYKRYAFPFFALILYLLLSVVGSSLIHLLAEYFLPKADGTNVITDAFYAALLLGALWLGCRILAMPIRPFLSMKRGIGFYMVTMIVSCVCILMLIGVLLYQKNQLGIPFSVYGITSTAVLFVTPFAIRHNLKNHSASEPCAWCGIIGSMESAYVGSENLGIAPKFHNEGGYYRNITAEGTIEGHNAQVTAREYVPETSVYDGTYKKTLKTHRITCKVCGRSYTESDVEETRID